MVVQAPSVPPPPPVFLFISLLLLPPRKQLLQSKRLPLQISHSHTEIGTRERLKTSTRACKATRLLPLILQPTDPISTGRSSLLK